MQRREAWLDAARGFGILLVVAAHVAGEGPGVFNAEFTRAAFLFHMPLFFVLSGYLYKPAETAPLLRKKLLSLAVPYVAFLALLTAAVIARDAAAGKIPALWQVRAVLANDLRGGMHLVREFGVFWFVTCLFFTQLIYNEAANRTKGPSDPRMLGFVGLSVALAYTIQAMWPGNYSPLAIAAVPLAIGCYWFGHLIGRRRPGILASCAYIAVVGLTAGIAASHGADFSFSMKYSNFGLPLLGLLIALAMSLAVLIIMRSFEPVSWMTGPLARLGEASLVIMFLHQFIQYSLRDIGISNEPALLLASVTIPYLAYLALKRLPELSPWFLGTGGGLPARLLDRLAHSLSWRLIRFRASLLDSVAPIVAWLAISVRWMARRQGRSHGLPQELVVSLTSYPKRYPSLALTLKCLLAQSVQADRTILWVAHEDFNALPDAVLDLQAAGLEIRTCRNIRSYKKIIPALAEFPTATIVTADDDVYYSGRWLEALVALARDKTIVCHRAHAVKFDQYGDLAPYEKWHFDKEADPRLLFPTGVGGVLYPPGSLSAEVTDEALFLKLCPNADDVWLFWMGRRAGSSYVKVPRDWSPIAWTGTQETALHLTNVASRGNDDQIARIMRQFGFPGEGASYGRP
ncbi:acyltransferase family protein [Mesorhizobium sp. WSM4904]|uniref:acyltransferase family protein n=1 Tax=Mesorhizobium sp. WSM4904 TaxID=3038545 RepID=UPI0024187ABF|nr:acyltransferase family protein [Mesorhizobium sp. WSM4904]WFP61753.1 acyltransferase family protein [Mesorhizobium sp. WSM4904]